jgi:hypothetical protein
LRRSLREWIVPLWKVVGPRRPSIAGRLREELAEDLEDALGDGLAKELEAALGDGLAEELEEALEEEPLFSGSEPPGD